MISRRVLFLAAKRIEISRARPNASSNGGSRSHTAFGYCGNGRATQGPNGGAAQRALFAGRHIGTPAAKSGGNYHNDGMS